VRPAADQPPAQEPPEEPSREPAWRRAWRFLRRLQQDMSQDNLTLVAAGVAFYWMLALFPAIIAMVTVYAASSRRP
jgi:membrane protein